MGIAITPNGALAYIADQFFTIEDPPTEPGGDTGGGPQNTSETGKLDNDCHRFADIVDQLAVKTNVIMATPDSLTLVQDF